MKAEVTYTATTTFLPSAENQSAGGGLSALLGDFAPMSPSGGSGSYFVPLIQSKAIAYEVVNDTVMWNGKKMLLADVILSLEPPASWLNRSIKNLSKLLGKPKPAISSSPTDNQAVSPNVIGAASVLKNHLSVEVGQEVSNQGIVSIVIKHQNSQLLKLVSYRYIDVLTEYYQTQKSEKARKNYEFYVHRTDSVKAVLDMTMRKGARLEDEEKYKIFLQDAIPMKETEGQAKILEAMYVQLVNMREVALGELKKETPTVQVLDYPLPPYPDDKPKLLTYLIGGIILGLFLSILLSIWKLLKADVLKILEDALKEDE